MTCIVVPVNGFLMLRGRFDIGFSDFIFHLRNDLYCSECIFQCLEVVLTLVLVILYHLLTSEAACSGVSGYF